MIIEKLNEIFSKLKYKFLYSYKNIQFYNQLITFWIEILIFGFENMNLELKYQFLDQRSLFEFKSKISYSNQKFEIQIIF